MRVGARMCSGSHHVRKPRRTKNLKSRSKKSGKRTEKISTRLVTRHQENTKSHRPGRSFIPSAPIGQPHLGEAFAARAHVQRKVMRDRTAQRRVVEVGAARRARHRVQHVVQNRLGVRVCVFGFGVCVRKKSIDTSSKKNQWEPMAWTRQIATRSE